MHLGELLTDGLLFSTFSFATAVALLIAQHLVSDQGPLRSSRSPASPRREGTHEAFRSGRRHSRRAARARRQRLARLRALALCGVNGGASIATWLLTGHGWTVLVPLVLSLVVAIAASRARNFTVAGWLLLVTHVQLALFLGLWSVWFIATIPVSTLTRALMFVAYLLLILTIPLWLIVTLEQWEVLCRKNWMRPRAPLPVALRDRYPKVSLHVPTYSEPPEVVISTLDALARLQYPNYEVLVIDNNTKDPDLWRPVEAHCRSLGERFRFFHLDQWPGAKAGALNFALEQTAPDAELVGVIDADYQAEPDFIAAIVGYFDDPNMGYVQTPHDYREWESSSYLRMCYWEYLYFYKTIMISRNERDAAPTVGTMCLVRRTALEEAGGWAEWCVTEDTELAVRIHALGYTSVYVPTTFGRGLIPETFSGYKRQRFRWSYGPVQIFKRHYRLFLPSLWGSPSKLSPAQKLHHLSHGLYPVTVGLDFLLIPLWVATVASMVVHQEVIPVPFALWLAATVTLVSTFALQFVSKVVMGCSLKGILGWIVASSALRYTVAAASLWGLFTKSTPWRRTNKFKALPRGLEALRSTQTELLLGLGTLLFAAAAVTLPDSDLVIFLLIGGVYQSLKYFGAPALALLAERDIRSRRGAASSLPAKPNRRTTRTRMRGVSETRV